MPIPFPKLVLSSAALMALGALGSCKRQESKEGGPGARAVPVTAAPVVTKEMPVVLRAVGSVRPAATVSVKPRVGGLIAQVHFTEGQEVEQGDVLFHIDAKPYEVALAEARALLAQVREGAANAQQQAQRYSTLGQTGAVTKEQLEQFKSTARASTAGAEAAEAAVREAEIQLGYCTIKSPIAGRTGQRRVDAGNVVVANTTELVVVNQIAPIEAVFALPEQSLADVRAAMGERTLKVLATPSGAESRTAEGTLTFIDNAVKPASATIDVKATFPNEDRVLWPGQFVEVKLTLATEPDAIVVPAVAVQTGQQGQYVFVVKADQTVEMRPVEMGRTLRGEAVIRKGLAAGESVITDGHLLLSPGAKVTLKPPVGSTPAPAPATPTPTQTTSAQTTPAAQAPRVP